MTARKDTTIAWICVGPDPKTGKIVAQENILARSKRAATAEMGRGKPLKWRDWRRQGWHCVPATITWDARLTERGT